MITIIKDNNLVVKQIQVKELQELVKSKTLKYIKKGEAGGFVASVILDKTRNTENIVKYTGLYCFDLDINTNWLYSKDKKYITDTEYETIKNDLNGFIDDFGGDMLFIKRSHSRTGLHIIAKGTIVDNINDYKNIWKQLNNSINERLKIEYKMDEACSDPTRQFYVSYDDGAIFNDDAIVFDIPTNYTNNFIFDLTGTTINVSGINHSYIQKLKKLDNEQKEELKHWAKEQDIHYNVNWGYMVKNVDVKWRQMIWNLLILGYKGDNKDWLKPFDNNYIETKFKNPYQQSLRLYFGDVIDKILNSKVDFLGQKYTQLHKINTYLSELNNINDIIFNKKNIILKAGAGCGKTTTIVNYIKSNPDKNFLIIASKNLILEKLYNDIGDGCRLFGKYTDSRNNRIILSNLSRINACDGFKYDYIIVDEAHLLVNFSQLNRKNRLQIQALYNIIDNNTTILLSATPEWLYMSLKDNLNIEYINIDNNEENVKVEHIKTITPLKFLMNSNFSGKTLIIKNDLKKCKELNETLKTKIYSSETKENAINILNYETIFDDTIIGTQYIGEGFNIMNNEPITIYVLYDINTDFNDIYQLVNRFRVAKYRTDFKVCFIGSGLLGPDEPIFDYMIRFNEYVKDANKLLKTQTKLNHKADDYRIVGINIDWFNIANTVRQQYIKALNHNFNRIHHINTHFEIVRWTKIETNDKSEGTGIIYKDLNSETYFRNPFWTNIETLRYAINGGIIENDILKKWYAEYEKEIKLCFKNLDKLKYINEVLIDQGKEPFEQDVIFKRTQDFKLIQQIGELGAQDGLYSQEKEDIKSFIRNNGDVNRGHRINADELMKHIVDTKYTLYKEGRGFKKVLENVLDGKFSYSKDTQYFKLK